MAGKYFEDLEVGAVLKHNLGRTITEMDNVLFSSLTMNTQPLHLNEDFARETQFGQRIVNGIFTLGIAVGLTVPDLTEGTLVANLGYENIRHPQPVFHGDTLYVETQVVSKRDSNSRPDQGIVRFRHVGHNQHGVVVIEFERTALLRKRSAGSGGAALRESTGRLRRSVLFVPGDSMRKISKAVQLDADSIILDLEDGVAANRKQEARQAVVEALGTLDFGRRERLVRLNPFTSAWPDRLEGLPAADLQATIEARPDGYVISKVDTPGQVRIVSSYLDQMEEQHGWPVNSIRLLAMIETAQGIVNLKEIAQASSRLEALIFGAEDLASDIGAKRTPASWEVFYARSAVVTIAAAHRLQPIDMVFIDLNDVQGLETECQFARQLGFSGKTLIHPRQVEVANRVFAPSPEEIDWALRLSQAFEAHQAAGAGAFDFEGTMVDLPIMRAAEGILARARLAGLLE